MLLYNMPKKETTTRKTSAKTKKLSVADKKKIAKRGKEFTDWMVKNANQKWFFSLEERAEIVRNVVYSNSTIMSRIDTRGLFKSLENSRHLR